MKTTTKSLLLIAVLSFCAITANAQLGIQAGYVNSQIYSKGDKVSDPYNGLEVGLNYNMPIMGGFSLQYGLLYTMLTRKETGSLLGVSTEYKSTGHYLNIPFRAAYTYYFTNDFGIFGYGGPNFAIGLAGKDKASGSTGVGEGSLDFNWYGDNGTRNRFDVKLGLGVGIVYKSLTLRGGYDWGLLNLSKDDNVKLNQNQFNISLGYSF